MPLPDERPRQSVANLIGRFEQQTKKQRSSSPGPRSSSVTSHTTEDSAKEEIKEKREWPPRTSNFTSPPSDSKVGGREWPPRVSSQGSGDSPGQRWPPIQPIIQASPFSELKKSPTSPLAKGSELITPQEVDKSPSPPAEPQKVIEVIPPSRKPTLVEPEPPKPVESEPVETPKTPPQPTVTPPTTKPGPSSAVAKSPTRAVKTTPTKPDTKTPSKPPPSSFTKGTSLHADVNERRTSTSARPPSRPTSRTSLRSKTPTSTQRKPPTETPKHTSTPVKRSKTPTTSHHIRHIPTTPSKPPPVIPKTPNSRLYAPTAASLAKSTNSPQPPPPERKKTLSSGVSLERLSKPTASSLSKSKSVHSLTSTTSPPKSKPTPTRTGTLTTAKKTTTISNPGGKTKAAGSTLAKNSTKKNGDIHEEHPESESGVGVGLSATGEILHPEIEPSDTEDHEHGSDREHEYLGNGSPEVSYTDEHSGTTDEAGGTQDHKVVQSFVDQDHVEEPEELVRSRSPESDDPASDLHAEDDVTPELPHEVSVCAAEDEELKQERTKDDIADIVGLLESTSFTSKHILQGSEEGVASNPHTPGSDKERQRIGEIPDEE
ncbi:hypothetical protein BDM02DRAFT_1931491 [Thelephora ganbajun]|uniref:Uncharacterized protein n=1 Tax=Thelephora ganbajun TaxID=370292 RepID=A0ACB6ZHG2_THEGA|nr:hypothetical protein BDM02DRAFT_1931491 [Thelephora ganbajun]